MVCPTVKPGPNWVCVNGDWRPSGLVEAPEVQMEPVADVSPDVAELIALFRARPVVAHPRRT
jgi:hypothetical protein